MSRDGQARSPKEPRRKSAATSTCLDGAAIRKLRCSLGIASANAKIAGAGPGVILPVSGPAHHTSALAASRGSGADISHSVPPFQYTEIIPKILR